MMSNYHVALLDLKVYALCTADRQDEWERGHDYQSEISHKLKVIQKAELLQELVDKATPKKPDKYVLLERDSLGFPTQGYCKKCGTSLLVKNNYCGRCGQALDWEND